MTRVADQWSSLWPALAFLLAGVPLAALLDRLGFFAAAAAVTTAVLNLDTTVVLLTPLYLRLARRAEVDPIPLVVIRCCWRASRRQCCPSPT